jgi:hypothetical protein
VRAILAQEFLHYLELLDRIIKVNMVSEEICSTMFEEKYADYHRLIKPGLVFGSDHILIRHISKRFNDGFRHNRVECCQPTRNPACVMPFGIRLDRVIGPEKQAPQEESKSAS